MTTKLRWGILGAANIARKNWQAIFHSGNSVLTAVASRDVAKSRQFIRNCQSQVPFEREPAALGSYEELIASPDVDAIYLPLPTALRKEWVLRAAAAGKHVLCEKPCAVSAEDLREMLDACRKNRVQFMDGVMFMHSHRLARLRETLDDNKTIGPVRRIVSQFSFSPPEDFFQTNIRGNSRLEPLGCLGDLGWYCVRFSLWTMNWQMPVRVTGRILRQSAADANSAGVPIEFSGELFFDGGVSASFFCSFAANQQWANVSGTNANLHIPDFVLPFTNQELGFEVHQNNFTAVGCQFKMEANERQVLVGEHGGAPATTQEANMIRNFANAVRSGQLNEDWMEQALKTQEIMDACLKSARDAE
ncbi:MAG: Gfo/Idh/MocA family oxidoreductase [Pedosphaera sp.]|nr:Gfo/Idh/MocA family oxidoreductase [Pedosphaera sp.]